MNLHKDRKDFFEQLKGTYINWEAFYSRMLSENIDIYMPEEDYRSKPDYAEEFDAVRSYEKYRGTESDIDWKMVSFRLLRFLGDYNGKWQEDCWERWFDFTEEKHKKVITQFCRWYEDEIKRQRTTFLPAWYMIKHTIWERRFGERI